MKESCHRNRTLNLEMGDQFFRLKKKIILISLVAHEIWMKELRVVAIIT